MLTPDEPTSTPTFICVDCHSPVYDALGHVRDRCWPCQWVHNIADPDERARVRRWLIELEVIDGTTG
jgi:hypothetical protein